MMLLKLQFCHLESMGESRKVFEKLVLLVLITVRCQKIGVLPVGSVSRSPQICSKLRLCVKLALTAADNKLQPIF